MADSRWASTDGNMATAASYAPSGVPIVNYSLYFDGSSNMDANSGMGTLDGFDGTRIWLQRPYQGDVGAEGNSLFVRAKYLIHQGSGSLYHGFDTVHTSGVGYTVVDSTNLQDAYTLTDGTAASGMSWYFLNGGSRILDNVNAYSIGGMFVGSKVFSSSPTLNIGTGLNTVTSYYQQSGVVSTKVALGPSSGAGYAVINGGRLTYEAIATASWNRLLLVGGYVTYNATGTLTDCVISSGTLDMTKDSRAKTITNLTIMPNGNFLTHANITVTKLIDLRPEVSILP